MGNRDRVRHTPKKTPAKSRKERRKEKHLREEAAHSGLLDQVDKKRL